MNQLAHKPKAYTIKAGKIIPILRKKHIIGLKNENGLKQPFVKYWVENEIDASRNATASKIKPSPKSEKDKTCKK